MHGLTKSIYRDIVSEAVPDAAVIYSVYVPAGVKLGSVRVNVRSPVTVSKVDS